MYQNSVCNSAITKSSFQFQSGQKLRPLYPTHCSLLILRIFRRLRSRHLHLPPRRPHFLNYTLFPLNFRYSTIYYTLFSVAFPFLFYEIIFYEYAFSCETWHRLVIFGFVLDWSTTVDLDISSSLLWLTETHSFRLICSSIFLCGGKHWYYAVKLPCTNHMNEMEV